MENSAKPRGVPATRDAAVKAVDGGARGGQGGPVELLRAQRLFEQMMAHPELVEEMRAVFRQALQQRGVISEEALELQARAAAARDGQTDPRRVQEYLAAAIDLQFAQNFSAAEITDHVNFARKLDSFRNLSRIVNTEGVTSVRIQQALREFCSIPQGEMVLPPSEAMGVRVALISHFVSSQLPFVGIAKSHIMIRDIDELLANSYWNSRRPGKIGGKAAGMFLAHKILLPRFGEADKEIEKLVCIPESYYCNSGILSDFVDYNNLESLYSHKYRSKQEIENDYRKIATAISGSKFPDDVLDGFRQFLLRVGEHPLILRSSTLLEDNLGSAFSGKYESVFLANQGDLEQRLQGFIEAVHRVHLSTYAPAPLLYRRDHKLLDFDERIAILVQKVVGRRFGDYFFPFASGVAYSHNAYRWTRRIRKEEGLVRMVLGLGTRAVQRVAADYPRMVGLSHPLLRPEVGAEQIRRYSQKQVDVLNLRSGQVEAVSTARLVQEAQHPEFGDAVSIDDDGHLVAPMFRGQGFDPRRACVTFENLLKKSPFVGVTRKILQSLHEAYGGPVDVEFAWDGGKFYLLQCRPLGIKEHSGAVELPSDLPTERILFTTADVGANGVARDMEYLVYVDPRAYAGLATLDAKLQVGKAVSAINTALEGRRYALFGPGRWGSNDINLGVRVGYEDISNACILGEVAFEQRGLTPEVSYGTHFFNDLVEAEIIPLAIRPDEKGTIFQEELLTRAPNVLGDLLPQLRSVEGVVRVLHLPQVCAGMLLQVVLDEEQSRGMGYLASSAAEG